MKGGATRRWFVASGPDSRHLLDVTAHEKLRDAKVEYAKAAGRAKQLFSLDFLPWECGTNKRILSEQIF